MLSFPNAKINIGLNVRAKRADGYHELETVFYPVRIRDAVESLPADEMLFTSSGTDIPGIAKDNLLLKAYALLEKEHHLPPLHIHLHKNIPIGAGIGGGSADAAFFIMQLNRQFDLSLSLEKMQALAAEIGADCPFFILNKPALATGRGDVFEEISLDLSSFYIVLVKPGIHISTSNAFKNITPAPSTRLLKALIARPVEEWRNSIKNDFEEGVFKEFPLLAEIKRQLYTHGALYAAMSGTGSALYALFNEPCELLSLEKTCRVFYNV